MSDDLKISYSIRIDPDLSKEVDYVVDDLFSTKTIILNECLRLGWEQLKKNKPPIMESSKRYHASREASTLQRVGEKKGK